MSKLITLNLQPPKPKPYEVPEAVKAVVGAEQDAKERAAFLKASGGYDPPDGSWREFWAGMKKAAYEQRRKPTLAQFYEKAFNEKEAAARKARLERQRQYEFEYPELAFAPDPEF